MKAYRLSPRAARIAARISLAFAAALILAVASCATSSGSTLGRVIAAQGAGPQQNPPQKPTEQPNPNPPVAKKGLEVVSDPTSAEVWIDGSFRGLSPYIAEDISPGWHKVMLRKTGYYETSSWIDFESDYMLFQTTLVQMTGYLQLSVDPLGTAVSVGGRSVGAGLTQLPVGTYTAIARLFGYTEFRQSVTIEDKATTSLDISLAPAEFAISSLSVPKPAVNPENPGLLGVLEASFSVTGPGTGTVVIRDTGSNEVFSQALPEFTTWEQAFVWNVRDMAGQALADGPYTLLVVAQGPGSEQTVEKEIPIRIDRTLKVGPRSLWSGSAGLLYAPVAESLPGGDFQVGILAAGISQAATGQFLAPVLLGARIGLGGRLELDASGGVIASSSATSVGGTVAARWNLLAPKGTFGTSMAVQGKLSIWLTPDLNGAAVLPTDTFANFTGISVEVPFEVSLGAMNFMLSAGAAGSLWYPYLFNSAPSAVTWLYLRAGIMLETGPVMAGISASTRTEPLPGGIAFIATPVPYQAGAEIHWLVPGTRIVLSGIFAGEYEDNANYYFMGGAGLGFLY
jgi:hypothetical protein